jgi:hypothetical protein
MTGEPVARRYPASALPEIQGIRLAPLGVAATLVNLSATGVLVECASRPVPGAVLTVHFQGTFSPALIKTRVVRCEVAGIATDGSLRYHLGLAFNTRITLPNDTEDDVDACAAAPSAPSLAAAAVAAAAADVAAPVLRNRW